jgi:hypothetical protein
MGTDQGEVRVPQACTLPTAEQPVRLAEFDGLFAEAVRGVRRPAPDRLRLVLEAAPAVAARAADLVARESGCCGFFTFTLTISDGTLLLDVAVPAAQAEVLDALASRATSASAGGGR